ncbi:MAG: FMN-binding protein [Actinomycetia bacterium]|nr:FMN-binding protein [Actinomycetes bacterium]
MLVTCVVAASGLAVTYSITAPRIAAQEKAAEEDALAAVLPQAADFEGVDDATLVAAREAAGDTDVSALYVARDDSGATVGWGLRVASRGYGGPINMVIGLDRNGKVVGLTILAMNETPGLGTRVRTEPWFLEQFKTLPPNFGEADVKKLDMISGATKSSRGVRNSMLAAGRIYEQVLSEKVE